MVAGPQSRRCSSSPLTHHCRERERRLGAAEVKETAISRLRVLEEMGADCEDFF